MSTLRDYQQRSPALARSRKERVRKSRGPGRKRRIRISLLVAPLLLIGLALWSYSLFRHSPRFRVEEIRVEQCAFVSPQEVEKAIHLESDSNIFLLDLSQLAERACRHPWIEEASIRRGLLHTLIVKVTERRPVGVTSEDPHLVSEDGTILTSLKEEKSPSLPLLRIGSEKRLKVGHKIDSPLFQRDRYFWRDFQQALKGAGIQIREICQAKDESVSLNLGRGMPLMRLKPESLEEQFGRLMEIFSRCGLDWQSLEYIDLRFPGKVIVKPAGKGGEELGKG